MTEGAVCNDWMGERECGKPATYRVYLRPVGNNDYALPKTTVLDKCRWHVRRYEAGLPGYNLTIERKENGT